MKNIIQFVIFFSCLSGMSAQESMSTEEIKASNEIFNRPEKNPTFPGCYGQEDSVFLFNFCAHDLMHEFIYDNLQYPATALRNGTEGNVNLRILVEKDGTISDFKVSEPADKPEFVEEAIRVIRTMPKWDPGEMKGIKIRSYAYVTVDFKIKDGAMIRFPPEDLRKIFTKIKEREEEQKQIHSNPPHNNASERNSAHPGGRNNPMAVFEGPMFPGCENETDYQVKKKCSHELFESFIDANIEYPDLAKANKVKGTVLVNFSIEKDGSITNIKVVEDIGAGCGEEAIRLVKMMPKWEPGTRNGRPIKVDFTISINFSCR